MIICSYAVQMITSAQRQTAVFIDGESMPASVWLSISTMTAKFGHASIVRVHGDFSNSSHAAWLPVCRDHGLEPVLYCPNAARKNGTDMIIAIAVMDLVHAGFSGQIVLVSNDRDFLPLARRLRQSGLTVCGMAMRPANSAERAVYSQWETVCRSTENRKTPDQPAAPALLPQALDRIFGESDSISLSAIGKKLAEGWPELHRTIGKNKLKARILKEAPRYHVHDQCLRRAPSTMTVAGK